MRQSGKAGGRSGGAAAKVATIERKIAVLKQQLAGARAKVKPRQLADHQLLNAAGRSVPVASLFGRGRELIVIHNMGSGCPYCTLWADGFNGLLPHLESRVPVVLESPDPPAAQKRFARARGWGFTMVSSRGSDFRSDCGFTAPGDLVVPGVSVLTRDKKGNVFQTASAVFGPGDNYCAAWDLFDLLPGGPGKWGPKLKY